MVNMVLGIFSSRAGAERAISEFDAKGYDPKDISILMKDTHSTGSSIAAGLASGVATGGVVGVLAGLLASTTIPGLGPFFIGGPIVTALGLGGLAAVAVSGAATGIVAGGVIGALTGWGLSEDEARSYEDRLKKGGILVAVPTKVDEEIRVRDIMTACGADQIRTIVEARDREREQVAYAHELKK